MSERITNTGLQNFLDDFKQNSHTEIFERGREKDEIIKIAKIKMGIDLSNNTDLAGFKTVYTFSDIANGNGARLPAHLLLQALPTLIGKPVNVNHVRNYVVGYYIDYRYIETKQQVVAYGLFFKSNFGNEWAEAKKLLKANLLGTSHEVWCPKRSRKYLKDGTYEATAMEFAGGALIYRGQPDPENPKQKMKTAYQGCDVLEMAMQHMDQKPEDLIFASLETKKSYDQADLIVASDMQMVAESEKPATDQVLPVSETPAPISQNITIPTITCGHCKYAFETQEVGEIMCRECKSIINREGKVLFPPQKIDFNFSDPEDGSVNWRIIEKDIHKAVIKNMNSGKIYELIFKQPDDNDTLMGRMNYIYMGEANCPQCGRYQTVSTPSTMDSISIICKNCGLKFHKNIKKDTLGKQIAEYQDITENYNDRISKKEAEKEMAEENKELHVASLQESVELETASLQEDSYMELETANLSIEDTTCELDIASLQEDEVSLELEIANQDSAEQVSSEDRLILEIASLDTDLEKSSVDQISKYQKFIRKMVNKVRTLQKEKNLDTANLKSANGLEIAKIQEEADQKIEFYKANAGDLIKRRDILGDFGQELSDEKIMDEDVYAKAKLEKENALLKASMNSGSELIGDKSDMGMGETELNRLHNEINEKAFK